MDDSQKGQIYLITHPSYKGKKVKVGQAKDHEQRLKNFNTAAELFEYTAEYVIEINNYVKVEKALIKYLTDIYGTAENKKEIFNVSADKVIPVLKLLLAFGGKEISKKQLEKEDDNINKVFNFDDAGIKPGSKLTYIKDENKTCTVIRCDKTNGTKKINIVRDDNDGKEYTLTALTKKLLNTKDTKRGPLFWRHRGEIVLNIFLKKKGSLKKPT